MVQEAREGPPVSSLAPAHVCGLAHVCLLGSSPSREKVSTLTHQHLHAYWGLGRDSGREGGILVFKSSGDWNLLLLGPMGAPGSPGKGGNGVRAAVKGNASAREESRATNKNLRIQTWVPNPGGSTRAAFSPNPPMSPESPGPLVPFWEASELWRPQPNPWRGIGMQQAPGRGGVINMMTAGTQAELLMNRWQSERPKQGTPLPMAPNTCVF